LQVRNTVTRLTISNVITTNPTGKSVQDEANHTSGSVDLKRFE
jgi:hypothetical protein